jgi:uncharacterized protein DUF2735
MTTSSYRGSATILQFPVRGRATVGDHGEEAKYTADLTVPRGATAAFGGSWYHEEAVQEAERARKN